MSLQKQLINQKTRTKIFDDKNAMYLESRKFSLASFDEPIEIFWEFLAAKIQRDNYQNHFKTRSQTQVWVSMTKCNRLYRIFYRAHQKPFQSI